RAGNVGCVKCGVCVVISSLDCPDKCICTSTTVKCLYQNLISIPQPLPPNTTFLTDLYLLHSLDLSNNRMLNFSPDAFPENNKLKVLNLSRSLYNVSYTVNLTCDEPQKLRNTPLLHVDKGKLQCNLSPSQKDVSLETSYIFLGMVLALIGVIFLLVLYLNRKGIKKWMYNIRDACRDHMEGYHYRYEINSDPRLANLSLNSDV
uniref:Trophoblast glycoprotein n=1 Tax=Astyanax mexicanus TaxID=7994 RepID=A0A3B1J604_ASTMX